MEDNMGEGLVLGLLAGGGNWNRGGWNNCGNSCDSHYSHHAHAHACGETLEGLSRTLHSNDLRGEMRYGRTEQRLDMIAKEVCETKEAVWKSHAKHQDRELCKQDQEILFLKGLLAKGHGTSSDSGNDIIIALGNTMTQLTNAVNSLVSAKQ